MSQVILNPNSGQQHAESFPTDSGTAVPVAGVLNILGADGVETSGSGNTVTVGLQDAVRLSDGYVENIGFAYDAGTGVFKVMSADGTDLSSTNPGYIGMESGVTAGEIVLHTITANQSFIDGNGASEIIGNLFGTQTGDDWAANDLPMYVYAVSNNTDTAIQFMLSRVPHQDQAPGSTKIGAPDDAVADTQGSFWSFDNIDETLFASMPAYCIGSFRIRKDASDDWKITPIAIPSDGVGKYQETSTFNMPANIFGASASTYLLPNGGTAPVFSTNNYIYRITRNGYVQIEVFLNGDGGTDGVGAVPVQISMPYLASNNLSGNGFLGFGRVFGSSISDRDVIYQVVENENYTFIYQGSSGTFLQNAGFGNGSRSISMTMWYWMEDDA